jgi:Fe-S-cluster containining protein
MEIDIPTRYGPLKARFNVPPGAMRLAEFVLNLFPLEERLVGMGVRQAQSEGRSVSCRAGCGACCRQPVPVSSPEAFLLYEYAAGQPKDKREAILERFAAAKEILQSTGFGERSLLGADHGHSEVAGMALDYFALGLACPFLESESCSIHPFRPTSCREHLVTSPAEMCAIPAVRAGGEIQYNAAIRPILAPASLTYALALLYAELEGAAPVYLPLILSLDHAATQHEARAKKYETELLFTKFFTILDPLMRSRIDTQRIGLPVQ